MKFLMSLKALYRRKTLAIAGAAAILTGALGAGTEAEEYTVNTSALRVSEYKIYDGTTALAAGQPSTPATVTNDPNTCGTNSNGPCFALSYAYTTPYAVSVAATEAGGNARGVVITVTVDSSLAVEGNTISGTSYNLSSGSTVTTTYTYYGISGNLEAGWSTSSTTRATAVTFTVSATSNSTTTIANVKGINKATLTVEANTTPNVTITKAYDGNTTITNSTSTNALSQTTYSVPFAVENVVGLVDADKSAWVPANLTYSAGSDWSYGTASVTVNAVTITGTAAGSVNIGGAPYNTLRNYQFTTSISIPAASVKGKITPLALTSSNYSSNVALATGGVVNAASGKSFGENVTATVAYTTGTTYSGDAPTSIPQNAANGTQYYAWLTGFSGVAPNFSVTSPINVGSFVVGASIYTINTDVLRVNEYKIYDGTTALAANQPSTPANVTNDPSNCGTGKDEPCFALSYAYNNPNAVDVAPTGASNQALGVVITVTVDPSLAVAGNKISGTSYNISSSSTVTTTYTYYDNSGNLAAGWSTSSTTRATAVTFTVSATSNSTSANVNVKGINRKPITINGSATDVTITKVYDGNTTITTSTSTNALSQTTYSVPFAVENVEGLVDADKSLWIASNFTYTKGSDWSYGTANVTTSGTAITGSVAGTFAFRTYYPLSNYQLATGANTVPANKVKGQITPLALTSSNYSSNVALATGGVVNAASGKSLGENVTATVAYTTGTTYSGDAPTSIPQNAANGTQYYAWLTGFSGVAANFSVTSPINVGSFVVGASIYTINTDVLRVSEYKIYDGTTALAANQPSTPATVTNDPRNCGPGSDEPCFALSYAYDTPNAVNVNGSGTANDAKYVIVTVAVNPSLAVAGNALSDGTTTYTYYSAIGGGDAGWGTGSTPTRAAALTFKVAATSNSTSANVNVKGINRKPITINGSATDVTITKVYDGNTTISTGSITGYSGVPYAVDGVNGIVDADKGLWIASNFTYTKGSDWSYGTANVTTSGTAINGSEAGTFAFRTYYPLYNYQLATGANTVPANKVKGQITPLAITSLNYSSNVTLDGGSTGTGKIIAASGRSFGDGVTATAVYSTSSSPDSEKTETTTPGYRYAWLAGFVVGQGGTPNYTVDVNNPVYVGGFYVKETTPDAKIDYENKRLTDLVASSSYYLYLSEIATGTSYISRNTGTGVTYISFPDSVCGRTVSLVKVNSPYSNSNSNPQTFLIPAIPTAPSELTAGKASAVSAADGYIKGVKATMEYRLFTAAGTQSWIHCDTATNFVTDKDSLGGLTRGIYEIRYKAVTTANKEKFASVAAEIPVHVEGLTTLATPTVKIDYVIERLTGFTNGAKYDINGTTVTVPDTGDYTYPIGTFGRTISIIALGDGTAYDNSDRQALAIPTRPAAPASNLFTVKNMGADGKGGAINGVTDDMEYRLVPATEYTHVPKDVTKLENLVKSSDYSAIVDYYYIRYKAVAAGDDGSGGSFASSTRDLYVYMAAVVVGTQTTGTAGSVTFSVRYYALPTNPLTDAESDATIIGTLPDGVTAKISRRSSNVVQTAGGNNGELTLTFTVAETVPVGLTTGLKLKLGEVDGKGGVESSAFNLAIGTYTVTYSLVDNGSGFKIGTSSSATGDAGTEYTASVAPGNSVTLYAVGATSGKTITWAVGDAAGVGGSSSSNYSSYTLRNVTADVRVTATVRTNLTGTEKYAVTFSARPADGKGGTLSAKVDGSDIKSGDSVAVGTDVIFTAVPAARYQFADKTGDLDFTTTKLVDTLTVGTADLDVSVTFEPIPITIDSVKRKNGAVLAGIGGKITYSVFTTNVPVNKPYKAYLTGGADGIQVAGDSSITIGDDNTGEIEVVVAKSVAANPSYTFKLNIQGVKDVDNADTTIFYDGVSVAVGEGVDTSVYTDISEKIGLDPLYDPTYTGGLLGITAVSMRGNESYKYSEVNGVRKNDSLATYKVEYTYTPVGSDIPKTAANNPALVKNAGYYDVIVKVTSTNLKSGGWGREEEGLATTVLYIQPKTLRSEMVTVSAPSGGYTYNGNERRPTVTVADGYNLTDSDWEVEYENNKNAGTGTVKVTGKGNYTTSNPITRTFAINKKQIGIDTYSSNVESKSYDGTDELAAGKITVKFTDLVAGEEIKPAGYTLTNPKLSSANVQTAAYTATATVALVGNDDVAKNYQLGNGSFSKSKTGLVTAREAVLDDFIIDTAKFVQYYNGTPRNAGTVSINAKKLKNGQPSGASVSYVYRWAGSAKDTSAGPTAEGHHTVKIKITNNPNFTQNNDTYTLSRSLEIKAPAKPVFDVNLPANETVRQGKTLTLSVVARAENVPADGTSKSTLNYQWYRNDTLISGATGASYNYTAPLALKVGTELKFHVMVKNNPGASIQSVDSLKSEPTIVTIQEAPKSLATARVTLDEGVYEYSGDSIQPSGVKVVTRDGLTLTRGEDYTYTVTKNLNAGTALVHVTGLDAYDGVLSATFTIAKKALEIGDLEAVLTTVYNGKAQPLAVAPTNGRTGLGAATVTYNGSSTVPTDAGVYAVKAKFAAGTNFTGSDTAAFDFGEYEITKRFADTSDVVWTKWASKILVADATLAGIGGVTMKPGFTEYGTIKVLYDGDTTVPTKLGNYLVQVSLSGGKNFEETTIELGEYNLVETIGVTAGDRVIPGRPDVGAAAVAPVKAAAAVFAVGPNVVSKSNGGKVTFFSGKSVKSGKLFIFDASGKKVAKVTVSQRGAELGGWDLKAKGVTVNDGSYVAVGALVGKDGTKEKVSAPFVVVK